MKQYFEKFKNLKGQKEGKLETNIPLVERTRFEGSDLFLDDKVVFTVPFKDNRLDLINVMVVAPYKVDPIQGKIYLGTGNSQDGGHLYLFNAHIPPEEDQIKVYLKQILPVDINVYDILPVYVEIEGGTKLDGRKSFLTEVLVSGRASRSDGVRFVNIGEHMTELKNIVTTEEYRGVRKRTDTKTLFKIEDERIILADANIDITSKLEAENIDIEKTLEEYARCYRQLILD